MAMRNFITNAGLATGLTAGALAGSIAYAEPDMSKYFDPEAFERGAKALREINSSPYAKKVFEQIKAQESTKQAELKAKEAESRAEAEKLGIEHERVRWEEQRRSMQQDAQQKAQLAQYQDELARKRAEAEHEKNRARNAELVALQEESARRQEEERARVAAAIEAERRATDRHRAELDKGIAREKALAEAEGRAQERRVNEDIYRKELAQKLEEKRKQVIESIDAVFGHLSRGATALLSDPKTLAAAVGGVTALALGVYASREGSRVAGKAAETWLGTPKLVRETSRRALFGSGARASGAPKGGAKKTGEDVARDFSDIVLPGELREHVRALAASTANTKLHGAPFRHLLFYGPPGTGKTLAAKRLAKTSGLDYAILSGGDVAPLGGAAVTQLHDVFDWASRSRKGLLLFVDEADAFLARRQGRMSEGLRGALNATLYRTGDQSRDYVVVLATNRPEDLDPAVLDRMDEALEFPLPGADEREQLLRLYWDKYILKSSEDASQGDDRGFFSRLAARLRGRKGQADAIRVDGVSDEDLRAAAEKTEGFSGRELAKAAASLQATAYGTADARLTREAFWRVIDAKIAEHARRREFVAEGDAQGAQLLGDA